MVVVRPMGGLGNQMYAYALGRALALKNGQELAIDSSWLDETGRERGVEMNGLRHFQIGAPRWKAPRLPLVGLLFRRRFERLFVLLSRLGKPSRKRVIVETACRYDAWIKEIASKSLYIRGGTWQSYHYFEDFQAEIRRDFRFRPYLYTDNREWADRIKAEPNSISVHIRRGDYVTNPAAAYTQGVCTPAYYERAIGRLRESIPGARFFFFSDDMAWVKSAFAGADFLFVERPASRANETGFRDDGHNDMYLMSLCRHNIIANSTFSWWAAYLNENPSKRVVAPGRWYADIADDGFIVPAGWERIDG